MSRFETPISNPFIADALRGLDIQSVLLARNFEQSSRLHAFVERYVEPDELEFDGMTYDHTRISAIGDDGSMLHIRLRRESPGIITDPSTRNIAVISHVLDANPATILPATSKDVRHFDGTTETVFAIGQPVDVGLRAVDTPMSQQQWDMELLLAQEQALGAVPVVSMTGRGWEYRRSDRHWEKLCDIEAVRRRVSQALSQGLGCAALPEIRQALPDTGQLDQKMVV